MNLAPLEQALAMRFPDAGARQRAALDALLTHGFPDRHVERWKYTRSAPYADFALRALAAQQPDDALDNTLTERLAQWQQQFAASYTIVIVNGQMKQDETRAATWMWLQANFPAFLDVVPRQRRRASPGLASELCSQADKQDLIKLFEAHGALAEGHERSLTQTVERIELCAALEAAKGAEVRAFFAPKAND